MAFLNIHGLSESFPHGIFPLEVILLHALVVITFTTLTDTDGTHVLQVTVDVARNKVIVLVSFVTETEDNIFEAGKLVFAVGEFKRLVGELLAEFNSVIRGFTFTVGSHDKEDGTVLGELVEILKVIFLRVTNERSKAELGLGFLCNTNGVLLSGTCL